MIKQWWMECDPSWKETAKDHYQSLEEVLENHMQCPERTGEHHGNPKDPSQIPAGKDHEKIELDNNPWKFLDEMRARSKK